MFVRKAACQLDLFGDNKSLSAVFIGADEISIPNVTLEDEVVPRLNKHFKLMRIHDVLPFPYKDLDRKVLFASPVSDEEALHVAAPPLSYKVYADGLRHGVAFPIRTRFNSRQSPVLEFDKSFVRFYFDGIAQGLIESSLFFHIEEGLKSLFSLDYLTEKLSLVGFSLKSYIHNRIDRQIIKAGKLADKQVFDALYLEAIKLKLVSKRFENHIFAGLFHLLGTRFDTLEALRAFVTNAINAKRKSIYERKKRFRRKAFINCWTHFVTFTCDDKKCELAIFERKLRKCLANLHTRYGWKYILVREYGKKTGRVHFHGLFYIPTMIGEVNEVKEYNSETRRMEIVHRNSFFYETFGRNDFAPVSFGSHGEGRKVVEYILKYMVKTNERLLYGFGIPTEVECELERDDFALRIFDYCPKFILYDDVFERKFSHIRNVSLGYQDCLTC